MKINKCRVQGSLFSWHVYNYSPERDYRVDKWQVFQFLLHILKEFCRKSTTILCIDNQFVFQRKVRIQSNFWFFFSFNWNKKEKKEKFLQWGKKVRLFFEAEPKITFLFNLFLAEDSITSDSSKDKIQSQESKMNIYAINCRQWNFSYYNNLNRNDRNFRYSW